MKIMLTIGLLAAVTLANAQPSTSDVWINEFHYDGITQYGQSDMNEFVEIAIKTSIATDAAELAKYRLVLYTSGAYDATAWTSGKGLPYNVSSLWYSQQETEHPLIEFTACPVSGTPFTLLSKPLPILQDVPAAFALVYDNMVIQLLSYEEIFTIAQAAQGGGPAAGMTTELITTMGGTPAMETASTPNTHSISLVGTGSEYANFNWDDGPTVTATPCAANTNTLTTQTFTTPLPVHWLMYHAIGAKDEIVVNWKVASEEGVARYVVEVSDMHGDYRSETIVPFSRNANASYTATIPGLKASDYRVRIRIMMMTGDMEFSATKLVRLSTNRSDFVKVFPNPVKGGTTTVTIIPAKEDQYTLELVDMNGKRVQSIITPVLQANTLNRLQVAMHAAPGIYQLKVRGKHDHKTLKLVILQ